MSVSILTTAGPVFFFLDWQLHKRKLSFRTALIFHDTYSAEQSSIPSLPTEDKLSLLWDYPAKEAMRNATGRNGKCEPACGRREHQLPDIAHSNTRENLLAIFLTAGHSEKKLFFHAKAISPSSHLCHLSHYFILWRRQGGHIGRMPTLKGLIPIQTWTHWFGSSGEPC